MKWIELRVEIPDKDNQLLFLYNVKYILASYPNSHFFYEEDCEIRLRLCDEGTTKIDNVIKCIPPNCKYWTVPYEGEEDFYGKNGWEYIQKFFHRNTSTALEWQFGNFEKSREFYARRYIHLMSNNLGYNYTTESKLYAKMAWRYFVISFIRLFTKSDEKTKKLLEPWDKLLGWNK
jgi:hypothetical protein